MKNVTEVWARYSDYTRDVTEHSRKLAFGGFAACWLFRDRDGHFPFLILAALALILLYCLADLAHPFVASLLVRGFVHKQESQLFEKQKSLESDIEVPRWLDRPAFLLYLVKIGFLAFGFLALVCHVGWVAFQN